MVSVCLRLNKVKGQNMNEDHQTQTDSHRIGHYEDEIELIDILRVIWKWKYLILVGTVVCGLAAAIVSSKMPKIYRINMSLRPIVLKINEEGKNIYFDSAENIKVLIEGGDYNDEINNIKSSKKNLPTLKKFKVTIPKRTNIIKISYETQSPDEGITILNLLSKTLLNMESEKVKHVQDEYENKIRSNKSELYNLTEKKQAVKSYIKNLQKRLAELSKEAQFLNNSADLDEKQKIELKNTYNNQIFDYNSNKEEAELNLKIIQENIKNISIDIKNMEEKKNGIKTFQILKSPTATTHPIRPKTKLHVTLAVIGGLFLMVLLAFFLEYLKNIKTGRTDSSLRIE